MRKVTSANTSGINPLVAASNQCFGMRARGCLRCGADLRAARYLPPFALLTAGATALQSVSRHCGASHLARPSFRTATGRPPVPPPVGTVPRHSALTCHKPPRQARVKPCAYAPLPSLSFVAVCLLLSCLASRSLSFGALRRTLSPPLSLSAAAPPRVPSPLRYRARPPAWGLARRLRRLAHKRCRPHARLRGCDKEKDKRVAKQTPSAPETSGERVL